MHIINSKQYKRPPIPHHGDGNDDSSDSSGDIFSPYQPFRPSLMKSPGHEMLPPLHDSSWIGARMSPIQSEEDKSYEEDNEEYREYTEPYRKALHGSIKASSNVIVNERTALIRSKINGGGTAGLGAVEEGIRSQIHPLWDEQRERLDLRRTRKSRINWGNIVCLNSGILLGCIGVHDLYFWYVSFRLGMDDRDYFSWKLPWLCPPEATLVRFGALVSDMVLFQGAYWRILSSMFMCSSVFEWVLVLWSWTSLQRHGSRPTKRWILLYSLSMVTGQLWMLAWDQRGVCGCASWGTSGVLCASGVAKPSRRFTLFMTTILFVILSLLQQPCSSILGIIGSSFFGWAFYGVGLTRVVSKRDKDALSPPVGKIQALSGILVLLLWILPIMTLASKFN